MSARYCHSKQTTQYDLLWQETSKTEVGTKIEFSRVMKILVRLRSVFFLDGPIRASVGSP